MAGTSRDVRYQNRHTPQVNDLPEENDWLAPAAQDDTDDFPKERRKRRKKKRDLPPPPPPILLTPSASATVLAHFTSFLAVTLHQLLYHRHLYPQPSFLLTRSHNLAVYQSRHPGVCKWVNDSVAAVGQRVVEGEVERIVFVVYGRACGQEGVEDSAERSSPPAGNSPTKGGIPSKAPSSLRSDNLYDDDRLLADASPMQGIRRDLGHQATFPPSSSSNPSSSSHTHSQIPSSSHRHLDPSPPPILERWTISLPLLPSQPIHPANHPSRRKPPSHRAHLARFRNPYHRTRASSLINAKQPFSPRYEPPRKRKNRPSLAEEQKDEKKDLDRRRAQMERLGGSEEKEVKEVNWGDVKEGLRGAIVNISRAAEALSKQEFPLDEDEKQTRTFGLAIEMRDGAKPPVGKDMPWLAAEADLQVPRDELEEAQGIGAARKGAETSWVKNVQAGPLHFECWLERGMDWGPGDSESEDDEWED